MKNIPTFLVSFACVLLLSLSNKINAQCHENTGDVLTTHSPTCVGDTYEFKLAGNFDDYSIYVTPYQGQGNLIRGGGEADVSWFIWRANPGDVVDVTFTSWCYDYIWDYGCECPVLARVTLNETFTKHIILPLDPCSPPHWDLLTSTNCTGYGMGDGTITVQGTTTSCRGLYFVFSDTLPASAGNHRHDVFGDRWVAGDINNNPLPSGTSFTKQDIPAGTYSVWLESQDIYGNICKSDVRLVTITEPPCSVSADINITPGYTDGYKNVTVTGHFEGAGSLKAAIISPPEYAGPLDYTEYGYGSGHSYNIPLPFGEYQIKVWRLGYTAEDCSQIYTITLSDDHPVDPVYLITQQPVNTTICSAIGSTTTLSVATNNVNSTYEWQYRKVTSTQPNPAWVTINTTNAGAVYTGYTTDTLQITKTSTLPAVGTEYRVIVSDGSTGLTSDTAKLTILSTAKAGTITSVASVCTGSSITFTLNNYAGTSIQWQSALDAKSTFTNIEGTTGASYTTTNLTVSSNKAYRAVVSNSCNNTTATTAAKTIKVDPAAVAGTITGGGVVCNAGTGTTKFTIKLANYVGKVQWQYSNATTDWTNVTKGTALSPFTATTFTSASAGTGGSYVIYNITGDTSFKALVTSGVCTQTATSDVVTYTLSAAQGGTLVSNASSALCPGAGTSLDLSGYTGTIKWMKSTNYGALGAGASWSPKSGSLPTLSTGNLSVTTWYKVVVSLGALCTPESNIVEVPVYAKGIAKAITASKTSPAGTTLLTSLCTDNVSKILQIASGYSGDIQWQTYVTSATTPIAPTATSWTPIDGANSSSYTVTAALAGKNYFRVKFTNGGCESTAMYSAPIAVYYEDCSGTNSMTKMVAVDAESLFDVVAYPNPFTNSFNLKVTSSSEEKIKLSVYDMAGRLLDKREMQPEELINLPIGWNYPTGVYNVLFMQGMEKRTLRMVKK